MTGSFRRALKMFFFLGIAGLGTLQQIADTAGYGPSSD